MSSRHTLKHGMPLVRRSTSSQTWPRRWQQLGPRDFGSPDAWFRMDECYADAAARFTAANSEYLSSTSSSFNLGNAFTIAFWAKADSLASQVYLLNKSGGASNLGYYLRVTTAGALSAGVSTAGTAFTTISSANGVVTEGEWFFACLRCDGTNIYLRINDTNVTPVACTGVFATTANFQVGKANSAIYHDGAIDSLAIWTVCLSDANVTVHKNGSAGKTYPDLSEAELTGLLAFYPLDEASGTRYDAHGSGLNLTDNNTVTRVPGIVSSRCEDGDPISMILDRSLTGTYDLSQPTVAKRATFVADAGNGFPAAYFDGTDDEYLFFDVGLQAVTFAFVYKPITTFGGSWQWCSGDSGNEGIVQDAVGLITVLDSDAVGVEMEHTDFTNNWEVAIINWSIGDPAFAKRWLNGRLDATAVAVSASTGTVPLAHLFSTNGANNFMIGHIAEVMAWARSLEDHEAKEYSRSLAEKYAVPTQ